LPYSLGLIVSYHNISQTNLTTGPGNDTIVLENCFGNLNGIQNVNVNAGGGFNTLYVVDQGYPWGDTYQIDSFGPGAGDVRVGGLGLVVTLRSAGWSSSAAGGRSRASAPWSPWAARG
jgi:hypothetical protein